MMICSMLRMHLTVIILPAFFLAFLGLGDKYAYAGKPDASNNNAEIVSITITPSATPAGTYPEITCQVRNTSSLENGDRGKATFDIKAVITAPNGTKKSLLWHEVKFTADQRKLYVYTGNYDLRQTGSYIVEYSVYNGSNKHLYTLLSKTFEVVSPTAELQFIQPSQKISEPSRAVDSSKTKKLPVPEAVIKKEPQSLQSTAMSPTKPPTDRREERKVIGMGAAVNVFNFSIGPSVIVWPFQNLAIQGTYGFGTFTSYEARTFYRFPLSSSIRPYLGVGYIHAERSTTVIGIDTKISGSSFTGFGGVEIPVSKNICAYIDISGTGLKLSQDVTDGIQQVTATVDYSPVTVCAGLMFYLF